MKAYQETRWYLRARRRAERVARDKTKARRVLEAATKKAGKRRGGPMSQVLEELQGLLQLGRAWLSGEYREVPVGTLVLVLATLAYFVSPIDAIPDILPFAGFIDDAGLIAWTVRSLRSDLENFRQWQNAKGDA